MPEACQTSECVSLFVGTAAGLSNRSKVRARGLVFLPIKLVTVEGGKWSHVGSSVAKFAVCLFIKLC